MRKKSLLSYLFEKRCFELKNLELIGLGGMIKIQNSFVFLWLKGVQGIISILLKMMMKIGLEGMKKLVPCLKSSFPPYLLHFHLVAPKLIKLLINATWL